MGPGDSTGQGDGGAPGAAKPTMRDSVLEQTTALATDLITRFPLAMLALLERLAALPLTQWPLELETGQRSAQALEQVRQTQAMLDQVCGPAPATASVVRAQVTDERPAGDVHAIYQIGGLMGSELIVALDHLSAELVIAQHRVGLAAEGSHWFAVLRDLRTLLNDPRVGALLDGPPLHPVGEAAQPPGRA